MHTGVHSFWSDVAANTDTSPESEQTAMRVLQRLVAVAMALPAIWTSDVVARAPLSMGREVRLCTTRFHNYIQRCLSLVRWHYSTRLCDAERSVSTSASHESSDAIDCIEKVLITKVARSWAASPGADAHVTGNRTPFDSCGVHERKSLRSVQRLKEC